MTPVDSFGVLLLWKPSLALLLPFSFSFLEAKSMLILWLFVVCPYLLVSLGFFLMQSCHLVLQYMLPVDFWFWDLVALSVFMLGFGEIQKLCCHSHHFPRIFKFIKFSILALQGFLLSREVIISELVTRFGSRVWELRSPDLQTSVVLLCHGPSLCHLEGTIITVLVRWHLFSSFCVTLLEMA